MLKLWVQECDKCYLVSHITHYCPNMFDKCPWVITHLSSSSYFFLPGHSKDLWRSLKKWRRQDEVKNYGLGFTLRVREGQTSNRTSWSSYQSWHNWAVPWTRMLWAHTWKVPPDAVLQPCWQSKQVMPSSPPHQRRHSYQSLVNKCDCRTKINVRACGSGVLVGVSIINTS